MTDELRDQLPDLLHGLVDGHSTSSADLFENVAAEVRKRRTRRIAIAAVSAVVVLVSVGVPALATGGVGGHPAGRQVAVPPAGSTGCPATYHLLGSTAAPSSSLATGTVPKLTQPGATHATVCRYAGMADSNAFGTLVQSSTLTSTAAATLSLQVAAAPIGSQFPCTANTGGIALVIFGYPNGSVSRVATILLGCGTAFPADGGPAYQLPNAAVAAITAASGATTISSSPPATPAAGSALSPSPATHPLVNGGDCAGLEIVAFVNGQPFPVSPAPAANLVKLKAGGSFSLIATGPCAPIVRYQPSSGNVLTFAPQDIVSEQPGRTTTTVLVSADRSGTEIVNVWVPTNPSCPAGERCPGPSVAAAMNVAVS